MKPTPQGDACYRALQELTARYTPLDDGPERSALLLQVAQLMRHCADLYPEVSRKLYPMNLAACEEERIIVLNGLDCDHIQNATRDESDNDYLVGLETHTNREFPKTQHCKVWKQRPVMPTSPKELRAAAIKAGAAIKMTYAYPDDTARELLEVRYHYLMDRYAKLS